MYNRSRPPFNDVCTITAPFQSSELNRKFISRYHNKIKFWCVNYDLFAAHPLSIQNPICTIKMNRFQLFR